MKLLYILGSFFPAQNGGPNNSSYWASCELVRRGVDVSVVSLKDGLTTNNFKDYHLELGLENNINGIRVWFFDYYISRYLSLGMFYWLILNVKKYDFVNLTSVFFPWTWVAALICIYYGIPFSIAPRGELESGAYCYGKKIKDLINFLFLRKLMSKARFVLVTSAQEAKFSRPFFQETMDFEIVPNYLDLESQVICSTPPEKSRDILYLGRIHPKKGIENLISAFNLLDSEIIGEHRLLIVGTGEKDYFDRLKEMASSSRRFDRIHFLGHRIGEEKIQIYGAAKVMVLPSYSENFGNVVLEALFQSTPVIASRFTPWADLETAGCGRWVDNNPESLAMALESILILNQEDYRLMAEASHLFVSKIYDVRHNGGKLKRLFERYL